MEHDRLNIAVIGTGISGMAAAWLLSQRHDVTVYEKDDRVGGHSNTVRMSAPGGDLAVDTGFIVFNDRNYPNLVRLFNHLGVASQPSDMSFSASLDGGRFEYSGAGLTGLLAQPRNALRPRMWRLVRDVLRFYREASVDAANPAMEAMVLGDYLSLKGYSRSFVDDHLLPMGAAIWSTPVGRMLDYPFLAFTRFSANHGLLQVNDRPQWRTVLGGSAAYVERLTAPYAHRILTNAAVTRVRREADAVWVEDRQNGVRRFDHVVLATHGDQALDLLADADKAEQRLLGAFRYERNLAILHSDPRLMPRSRRAWASWNFMDQGGDADRQVAVTYWMNRLQMLPQHPPLFVSLNPQVKPAEDTIHRSFLYEHPVFDLAAIRAQQMLWNLQGLRRTWYCGAYFGHGFHEDGLQAGLAVAEQLGGVTRPWDVADPNGRIHVYPAALPLRGAVAA